MEEIVEFFVEAGVSIVGIFLFFQLYRILIHPGGGIYEFITLFFQSINGA